MYRSKSIHLELSCSSAASIKEWIPSVSSQKDCVRVFWEHLSEHPFAAGSKV